MCIFLGILAIFNHLFLLGEDIFGLNNKTKLVENFSINMENNLQMWK